MMSLSMMAQTSKFSLNGNWILTDIKLCESDTVMNVNAMIDTGCTDCIIDSTYAYNCGGNISSSIIRKRHKGKEYSVVVFDSLIICGKTFKEVECIVHDLSNRFKTRFDFLVGANVLSKQSWKFNMKDSLLEICESGQKFESYSYKWENDKNYMYIPYNGIVFAGKLAGKKSQFYLDTGNSHCYMNQGVYDGEKEIKQATLCTAYGKPIVRNINIFKNVKFNIGDTEFCSDFIENIANKKKYNTINISVLKGKSFVLDYPKRTLHILK